ncbi:MAG TPA: hypothetical protein VKA26_00115 [Ignavibacteriaceae bacterium]|nr:hypothetical protein [Ignavibacteriaceae bacterium]
MRQYRIGAPKLANILNNFLLKPSIYGLYGFSIFFSVIVIVKTAGFLVGTYSGFNVDYSDLDLSFIGFSLLFMVGILKNFQDHNKY